MIGNNLAVHSDVFLHSLFYRWEIGLFLYVLVLPVCGCLPVAAPEITCLTIIWHSISVGIL